MGEFRGWRRQALDNIVNGCILIGDAGSMVMPLTGEGIGPAMVTGKLAAMITREALEKDDLSAEFLSAYTKERDAMYAPKYKSIKQLENAFASAQAVNGFVHKIVDDPVTKEAFIKQWYFESYEGAENKY